MKTGNKGSFKKEFEKVLNKKAKTRRHSKLNRHSKLRRKPITREDKIKTYAYPLMEVPEAVNILQLKEASSEEILKV